MGRRLELNQKFIDYLNLNDGKPHVYFQPPKSVILNYPCIIYRLTSGEKRIANNNLYNYIRSYNVTIIDEDPDVEYDRTFMESFPYASFNRAYTEDYLNHWVFNLYY